MELISFSDFLSNLNLEQKKQFKQYEKISYRIINTTNAIKFNNICLQEHLCPKTIQRSGRMRNSWHGVENQLLQRNKINAERFEELSEIKT